MHPVQWDGDTPPRWFYETGAFELVRTTLDVGKACEWELGNLVCGRDGIIRRATKSHRASCELEMNCRKVPNAMISLVVRDGMRCCTQCKQVQPVGNFTSAVHFRDATYSKSCTFCRTDKTRTGNTGTAKYRARIDGMKKLRIDAIRESGCLHPGGCVLNPLIPDMSDAYLTATFEFNHIDPTKKRKSISEYSSFTAPQAAALGYPSPLHYYAAEMGLCEVLCRAHHSFATQEQRRQLMKRAIAQAPARNRKRRCGSRT